MDEFTKRLVHLVHCPRAGWKTIYYALKSDPELKHIYRSNPQFSAHTNESPITIPQSDLLSIPIEKLTSQYVKSGIRMITLFDKEYPPLLKEIYQPPWVLFAKGNLSLLDSRLCLAVVGARDASAYGKAVIEFLLPELVRTGFCIVSGLAKGIDTQAHRTAIRLGGQTIGVIAGGFNHLYPKENKELASRMAEHHLLLSEYPPGSRPERWQFPLRNRIISGLSRGTVVIEAKQKSGSLITAEYSLNEGREVFAIPGSILTSGSAGVHELIQQGAKLVKQPQDILDEFL
ncbi:DNA-processing protein DprA [Bacillus sp. T33-2]|uniref:DNA-processing protein DprA n=1 Tax=Bacillus sp. T33-2 TaxID=2054168 RepID=UPI000C757915|nr:DNA-processing protein DprA [Bacillus sp. T33-2]PLR97288.1 DNA-protecting protein DprA [Bacillus sp. T33-2]